MAQLDFSSIARQRTVATPIEVVAATVRGTAAEAAAERASFIDMLYATLAFTGLFIVVCCGAYPVLVWGVAQALFPVQANGSLITRAGVFTTDTEEAVGSAQLGQNFAAAGYFHPRPSAAGSGYDAANSGGTNLGPLSDKLLNGVHGSKNPDGTPNPGADFDGVRDLVSAYRAENGLPEDAIVPVDAVTRSASGLDPHISPANARLQAARVASARGLGVEVVQRLIEEHTDRPAFGILGDPGVNVLMLNLALDKTH
jgi:K+-transporting ATPase ATPase C chain